MWKDTERANEAAEALKLTAPDLLALGIVDGIVDDRGLSHEEIAGAVMSSAFDAFDTLGGSTTRPSQTSATKSTAQSVGTARCNKGTVRMSHWERVPVFTSF